MDKKTFIACGLLAFAVSMQAQTKAGGIDKQMMDKITAGSSQNAAPFDSSRASIMLLLYLARRAAAPSFAR